MKRPYKLLICNSVSKKITVPHSARSPCKKISNNGGPVYLLLLDAPKAFDRIQCVKIFKCLIERDIYPLIARLIAAIFYKTVRTSPMGSHFSKPFITNNAVKQGGVLSSVLFTLYIDKLLNRLRQSNFISDIFLWAHMLMQMM